LQVVAITLLISGLLITIGCSKPGNDNDPKPTDSTGIKKPIQRLLKAADGSSSSNATVRFEYDSTNKLKRIEGIYAGDYYVDVYHDLDTLSHMILPFYDQGAKASAAIFLYRPDKKLDRVIYTATVSPEQINVTMQDARKDYYLSGQQIKSIYGIDSLVYNGSGQLIELWCLNAHEWTSTSYKFYYDNSVKKSPSRIENYSYYGDLDSDVLLTTNNMESETYRSCWFLPFLNRMSIQNFHGGPTMPITPKQTLSYNFIWAMVPNCITQYKQLAPRSAFPNYTSPEFMYYYSEDSLTFFGRYVNDDITFPRFQYYFDKK